MSTRGCVAISTTEELISRWEDLKIIVTVEDRIIDLIDPENQDFWIGVYNHNSSYPEGLGKQVFDHIKKKDLIEFSINLLKYDDWRNYLNGGICPYCGQKGLGQPHSFSRGLYSKWSSLKYKDIECKYHKHGDLNDKIRSTEYGGTLDYIYIINPVSRIMNVVNGFGMTLLSTIRIPDKDEEYEEPNWESIKKQ